MKSENKVDEKIEGPEVSESLKQPSKTKCRATVAIAVILLVSAAIAVAVVLLTKPKGTERLVEVNLNEGDSLMYRVDQRFKVTGQNVQKETISSIVGIKVVNKTSDEYWFLLKINVAVKDKDKKSGITGYFNVRLQNKLSREKAGNNKKPGNETIELFELHGYPETDKEFVHYLHGILYQLLPAVSRDLYEDIDGQSDKHIKPENSPLFPGPVRMHRKANTKSGDVLIKNHFNQSDLVNSSSDMDLDVKYTDSAAINKSNGMVSESSVYVSELLYFNEPIKTKDGRNVSKMEVTLYSHVTRIEFDSAFFVEEEIKVLKMDSFVRLVVPTEERVENNKNSTGKPLSRNSSSVNDSVNGFSTQEPTTVSLERNSTSVDAGMLSSGEDIKKRRVRRSAVDQKHKNALRSLLTDLTNPIERQFTLFEKKVIGINIKAESTVWMKVFTVNSRAAYWALGSDVNLKVGGIHVPIYGVQFTNQQIEDEEGGKSRSWSSEVPICFKVLFLRFCVKFSINAGYNIPPVKFVTEEMRLNPLKLALKFEHSAHTGGSVEAYASLWILRSGVFVDGTIFRVALPTKLSYSSANPVRRKWSFVANAELTALELEAGLFYQWWSWWYWAWGSRNTVYSFGKWSKLQKNWKLFEYWF